MKALVAIFFITGHSFGHSRLNSPTPRSTNPGIKTGQCGGLPRSTTPATFEVGKQYTFEVEETIQHNGHFIVNLLNGGEQKMVELANVVDSINVGKQNITVTFDPAKGIGACNDCVIQLIQSMEVPGLAPSFYYSCADIKLVDPNTMGTPIPPMAAPTPGPVSPDENPPTTQSSPNSNGDSSGSHATDGHCSGH